MDEHVRRNKDKETQTHYLSHDIQNKLIELIANEIPNYILSELKIAKFYAIIVDCMEM